MARDAKEFDYEALLVAGRQAQQEIATWPKWKQQAAAASFVSRPERESEQQRVTSELPKPK